MDIEKSKERCKELTKEAHAGWIGISNQMAIGDILNELEKKDNMYIKEYNEHMEKKRQNGVLINNERILKMELEKKDKVINEMAKYIDEIIVDKLFCGEKTMCDENCTKCIKEYFTKKVEGK